MKVSGCWAEPANPHAVRIYAPKALKGVWGKNKSFSPTVFRNLLLFGLFRQAETAGLNSPAVSVFISVFKAL